MTERVVQQLIEGFGLAPGRENAFAPVPLQATDFTLDDDWLDFIDHDELKTTGLTLKSVVIMDEVQERSWEAIHQVELPIFALTATGDRIVDNRKVREYIGPLMDASPANRWMEVESGHAVQFEMPEVLAEALLSFIDSNVSPARP